MQEPNSFESPEFLKDLEFIDEQVSKADPCHRQSESQPTSSTTKLTGVLVVPSPPEVSSSSQELELTCLATGATGAAIALVRGEEIVCYAAVGPHTPDVGESLNPRTGLSGACIQTRRLQQCDDTETDLRVDPEACRHLGVRSIVVLPLMNGDDLFGIFEVFSSRPNAFGQRDLEILQLLAHQIVENRRQNWQATATVPPKQFEPLKSEGVVPVGESRSWLLWQSTNRSVVENPYAFLATTTTRLCINVAQSAHSRHETHSGTWRLEPVDASSDPALGAERGEALRLAVLILLEKLTPAERAAYILREAFDYSYRQIANILQMEEANTRQLVSRARKHIADRRRQPVGSGEQRRLLEAFIAAAQQGNMTALEGLFAEGVVACRTAAGLCTNRSQFLAAGVWRSSSPSSLHIS